MKKRNRIFHLSLAILFTLGMTACSSHGESSHEHEHEHGHEHTEEHEHEHEHGHGHEHGGKGASGEIVIDPSDAARLGVEVGEVIPAPFIETIRVAGEILPSSADRGIVSAPTSGVIHLSAGINPGVKVTSGQAVARISSQNVSGGDSDETARIAMEAAKRELDRITPLLADGIVTRKDYNDALAAFESAKAAYSPKAASGVATSPRAGVITSIDVSDGEYVETGQLIATVASNTRLTLRALVPVSYAEFLPRVGGARICTSTSGSTVDIADYNGRLLSSAPASGYETPGYVPVYFTFDSAAPVIPGTASEVYLKGAPRASVISLPLDAVVEQMGQKFVFVQLDEHGYEKRPVTVGRSDGERVEITSGLKPGEHAVTGGATFVRLAEQASVAPEGHSHNH